MQIFDTLASWDRFMPVLGPVFIHAGWEGALLAVALWRRAPLDARDLPIQYAWQLEQLFVMSLIRLSRVLDSSANEK